MFTLIKRLLSSRKYSRVIVNLETDSQNAKNETSVNDAKHFLTEIDATLRRHGGRRISKGSTIVVETTREGIEALKALENVHSVIEDRPASRIS
jgi:hypothetical protein